MIPLYEPILGDLEEKFLLECLRSGWISSRSPMVDRFEERFLKFAGAPHGFAVSSGSGALHLALLGLGIGPGDDVVIPSYSFSATASITMLTGANPVFCDVNPVTWVAGAREIEKVLTPSTRAVMAVHTYGITSPVDEIAELLGSRGIFLVEDAAESLGSRLNGIGESPMAGTSGDAGVFSFYGNKTITTGEGGFVLFRDEKAAETARRMRGHGSAGPGNYESRVPGFSHRMTGMQAAVGIAQIERFDEIARAKRRVSEMYAQRLDGLPNLTIQGSTPGHDPLRWLFAVAVGQFLHQGLKETKALRDETIRRLRTLGVEAYPAFAPLHTLTKQWSRPGRGPVESPAGSEDPALPVSDALGAAALCLPSGPGLTADQIDRVCKSVAECLKR